MKMLTLIFAFAISFASFADDFHPPLDLTKIKACPNAEAISVPQEFQGRYGTTGAKKPSEVFFARISQQGMTEISNIPQTDANGNRYYLSPEKMNAIGFCVSQKIIEGQDGSLTVRMEIKRAKNSIFMNTRETNRFSVKFKDGKVFFKSTAFTYGRLLIFPASAGSIGQWTEMVETNW